MYVQETPTKRALTTYTKNLARLYYNLILHRTAQPEHVRFKLQDIVLEDITPKVTDYVQNYLLKIRDKLKKSFNVVNNKNENNKKNV